MSSQQKTKPAGVPEENVYDGMHWSIYIAIVAVAAVLYVIVNAGS